MQHRICSYNDFVCPFEITKYFTYFIKEMLEMEFLLFIVVVIGVLGWFIWKDRKFEESGSHPLDGATKSSVLDVNKDGQVDLKDAVAAAEVVVEKTKKTAAKTKAVAKATATKVKTAAKKTVAKKTKK